MSEKHEVKRPKRVAIELRNRLHLRAREGFVQRWVNEDRYEYCLSLGYIPIVDESRNQSQHLTQDPSSQGSSLLRMSVGGGRTAIAMEIEKEIYDEYKAVGQEEVDEIENSMKGVSSQPGSYGETKIER